MDELDGKITEEFSARQSAHSQREEELAMQGLEQSSPVEGGKILELANKAYFLLS